MSDDPFFKTASGPASPVSWPGWVRRRLLVLAGLYLVALLLGYVMHVTDRLILFPTTHSIPTRATSRLLQTNDSAIEVFIARAPRAGDVAKRAGSHGEGAEPACFVLEFTGNATRAEHVAEESAWVWREQKAEIWAVNYPGYGKSAGPARLKRIAETALQAYDELARRAAGRPIYVVGTSLGTTAALHVAAQRPAAGLLLMNPPPLRQLILGRHGWWNLYLVAWPVSMGVPAELDSIANAARVSAPAVFVLSERDEIVPVSYQERVAASYAGPKQVLRREGRGHNDPVEGSDQLWLARQIDWLTESSGQPSGQASTAPSTAPSTHASDTAMKSE
jgi:uncharacterized protein